MTKSIQKASIKSDQTEELARLLLEKEKQNKKEEVYASSKTVLSLLGAGAIIAGAFIAPKAASSLANAFAKESNEWEDWKKFNQSYLRQTLRRLERQKLVEIKDVSGKHIVTVTDHGKTKILQYSLDSLEISKQKRWDNKWRIIIYDIPNNKKKLQNIMRQTLKRLGFIPMQESVYLTPYPCFKEIEFLRQYYHLGDYIQYLLVEKIENDSAYRAYFGIK